MIKYSELRDEVLALVKQGENIVFALGKVANKYNLDFEQCGILQDAVLG